MLYKINTSIVLNSKQDYDNLWATLKDFIKKNSVVNLNIGKINEEKTKISRHECLHEENLACLNLETVEK